MKRRLQLSKITNSFLCIQALIKNYSLLLNTNLKLKTAQCNLVITKKRGNYYSPLEVFARGINKIISPKVFNPSRTSHPVQNLTISESKQCGSSFKRKMQRFNWKLTIKPNIVALRLLGLWPEGNEGYKKDLYAVYAFTFLNLFINCHNFFQAVNIFFVYTDLEALTAIIFVTITDLLASIKVYYFVRNIKQLKALMAALDTQVFQPRRLDEEHTFYYGPKFWRFIYVVYHFPVIPTLTAWTIYPVMDGSVKDYRLPFSAWYPYNSRISPYYEITYGYQVLCIWFSAFAVINTDSMITALMMFIRAQCDILNDSVKNLGSLSSADYNSNLLQCVHHHRTIIRFF